MLLLPKHGLRVTFTTMKEEPALICTYVCANEAGQIQIGPAVQVQLVFQHLVHSVSGGPLLWDHEFGNLFLTGIAGRVWRDGGNSTLGVDMMLVCFA